MHGTTMIFLFVVPVMAGFGNYFVPLMIGARDMAFPRLNALSYWLLLFGGIVFYATLFWQPPEAGWWSYPPLSSIQYSPSAGQDAWIFLIHITGISSLLGAINFYVTIVNMRAPGMSWGRLPLFIWAILVYAVLLIIALPVVAAAVTMLLTDRHFGTHFFDPTAHGSPVLWQHLFWFFGHPEVYIMILPGFGIISEVIPVFSRKPIFGYKAIAASTAVIAFLATLVWAHHMFASPVPIVVLGFFMLSSFLIGVPTGVKIFNWIATLWRGSLVMTTALYFAVGLHRDLHHRRDHRDLPGRVPGRLAAQRHLFRRRPLPLRADGRRRVHDLLRDLLLVPEDHRPDAQRDAREDLVLADVHRLQRRPSSSSTRSAWTACRGGSTPTSRGWAGRRGTWSRRSAPTSSAIGILVTIVNVAMHYKRGQARRARPVEGQHAGVVHDVSTSGQQFRRHSPGTLRRADARHPATDRARHRLRAEDRRQRAVR